MRIRAAAVSSPRTTGNHPTVTPPPPSLPHSPQEQAAAADVTTNASANAAGRSTVVIAARNMLPALPSCQPVGLGISQVSLPPAQLSPSLAAASTTTAQPVCGGDESTPQPSQPVQGGPSGGTTTANTAATSNVVAQKDDVPAPTRRPSVSSGGPGVAAAAAPATPDESGSGTGANTGAGSSSGTATGNGSGPSGNGITTPGTPGGGIIGKLRGFGRATKRAHNENAPGTPTPTPAATRATGSTATGATGQASASASTSASSTVVVTSAAPAAASTSTAPSSTLVCPIYPPALPFPCCDGRLIWNVIGRYHKNCPRNHAQPLKSSFPVACSVHRRPPMHPPSLSRRTYPFSSRKSARLDGPSCIVARPRARGLRRTWRRWRTRYQCGCWSICCLGARRRLRLLRSSLRCCLEIHRCRNLSIRESLVVPFVLSQIADRAALIPFPFSFPFFYADSNQTKLSASRFLRVRKLAAHVSCPFILSYRSRMSNSRVIFN
jgi:hypothetical protein